MAYIFLVSYLFRVAISSKYFYKFYYQYNTSLKIHQAHFKYSTITIKLSLKEETTTLHLSLRTIEWKDNKLVMIDQTKLPNELVFVEFTDYNEVANAIRTLVVRGAPAIGVSGAFGLALAALQSKASTKEELIGDLEKAKKILFETRPTAVNLSWGLEKIMKVAISGISIVQIKESVINETRPVQQGSRLTAFELKHDGFDVSLIPDTAVGYTMAKGLVHKVVVGADRILRTGHVFNKIGTYQVALIAKQHGIPFYVAAPLSTFDLQSNPEDVIIEQRNGSEVTGIGDKKTAPDGINVINPAFDMTPPELISGIITEKGIAKAPFGESIKKLFEAN